MLSGGADSAQLLKRRKACIQGGYDHLRGERLWRGKTSHLFSERKELSSSTGERF